jgi:hypothetical protein
VGAGDREAARSLLRHSLPDLRLPRLLLAHWRVRGGGRRAGLHSEDVEGERRRVFEQCPGRDMIVCGLRGRGHEGPAIVRSGMRQGGVVVGQMLETSSARLVRCPITSMD